MISRRKILGVSAAGAVLGLVGIASTKSRASIRFIGRRETIIALLDTGSERAIFILGERDDELLGRVPGLSTIGNTRIDLVIGSYQVLATRAAREHLRLDSVLALSIQADAALPPIRGDIKAVTQPVELELGGHTWLRISPSLGIGGHADVVAEIYYQDTTIVLAGNAHALRMVEESSCELVAIPGPAEATILERIRPQLLVCSSPNLDELHIDQMQVYPNDPQVVHLERAGIRVRDDQLSS